MTLRILRPGILMTVQDGGRHGYQHLGLCPGGAMDPVALALANALVGNDGEEGALEITVLGPDLEFWICRQQHERCHDQDPGPEPCHGE